MPKQKRKQRKRSFKLIAFKAYHDSDSDIIEWWEGIEDGERSDTIRALIREQIGTRRQPRRGQIIELPELMEVRRNTLWIKDALNEMPAYLERVIEHVAAAAQVSGGSQAHPSRASPQVVAKDEPALTDAETQRRTRRMKNATW